MPGSIRTRHPRPTEAGTKASWQEFLHSEPHACGTSPPPPKKSTSDTTRSGKLSRWARKRPTRLNHGGGGGKRTRGGKKKKPRPSFASTHVKQKAWGGGLFFFCLPGLLLPPALRPPASSRPPSPAPSPATPASRQK